MSPLMYRDYRCDVYADATGAGWEGVVTGANEQSLGTFFTSHESEIRAEFHTTVNEYLAVCQERGFSPISPIRSADPDPKSRTREMVVTATSKPRPAAVRDTHRDSAKV